MVTEDLIARCLREEPKAQYQLYKVLYGEMMSICSRYERNKQDAAARMNQGFLKILTSLNTRRPEVPFEYWTRRIMINTVIDEFRKERQRKTREVLDAPLEGQGDHDVNDYLRDMEADAFAELLQRVPLVTGNYTLNFDLRAPRFARVSVGVCQQHLLYVAACTRQVVVVTDGEARWRHFSLPLDFRSELPDRRWVPALGFLAVHLEGGADFVDVDNLGLLDGRGRQLLANGSFTSGLGQWYFAARHYFLPWHVDNLFLEVLIDQGAVGLSLLLTLLAMAFARLLWGRGREHVLAPYLLAALSGCLAVAVFSNVLDMPRSAFLFYLLLCSALFLDGHPPDAPSNPRSGSLKAPRKAPHAV